MAVEDVTASLPPHSPSRDFSPPHSSTANISKEANSQSENTNGSSEETVRPSHAQTPDARLLSTAASPDIEMTTIPSSSESQSQSAANNPSNFISPASTLIPPTTAAAHDNGLRTPTGADTSVTTDSALPNISSTVDGASDSPVSPLTPAETNGISNTLPQPSRSIDDGNLPTAKEPSPIGPSSDAPLQPPTKDTTSGPVLPITLLLITGARHPFSIDSKYLKSRNVPCPNTRSSGGSSEIDPFSISVYTLKELIHRDWRDDWEPRPTSPNYIRLIHFGRLLQDSQSLKDCRLNASAPNVIHMTVKPQDLVDDDGDAYQRHKMSRQRNGRGNRRGGRTAPPGNGDGEDASYSDSGRGDGGCCRCIIQ